MGGKGAVMRRKATRGLNAVAGVESHFHWIQPVTLAPLGSLTNCVMRFGRSSSSQCPWCLYSWSLVSWGRHGLHKAKVVLAALLCSEPLRVFSPVRLGGVGDVRGPPRKLVARLSVRHYLVECVAIKRLASNDDLLPRTLRRFAIQVDVEHRLRLALGSGSCSCSGKQLPAHRNRWRQSQDGRRGRSPAHYGSSER